MGFSLGWAKGLLTAADCRACTFQMLSAPSVGRFLDVEPTWGKKWRFAHQSDLVVLEERSSMMHSLY